QHVPVVVPAEDQADLRTDCIERDARVLRKRQPPAESRFVDLIAEDERSCAARVVFRRAQLVERLRPQRGLPRNDEPRANRILSRRTRRAAPLRQMRDDRVDLVLSENQEAILVRPRGVWRADTRLWRRLDHGQLSDQILGLAPVEEAAQRGQLLQDGLPTDAPQPMARVILDGLRGDRRQRSEEGRPVSGDIDPVLGDGCRIERGFYVCEPFGCEFVERTWRAASSYRLPLLPPAGGDLRVDDGRRDRSLARIALARGDVVAATAVREPNDPVSIGCVSITLPTFRSSSHWLMSSVW